jgi:predicted ABC-type transport system involved in lysophospholipase L1 biosynthesis ATPase subunit
VTGADFPLNRARARAISSRVDAVVSFRDVSREYRTAGGAVLRALRGATGDVPGGRAVAVTGRSGSGKSTLLHLAAGIDEPSGGEVVLLGRSLGKLGDAERTRLRRDHVGLVFQFFHLLPHLTALENVLVPSLVAGDPARDAEARARALLARVGLAGREGEPAQKLSGGEMQRVALCRALQRRPRLLLADEPTGNLDEENGRKVLDLLLGLAREEGSAVLFVTHSREIAEAADAIWTLHSGVLEAG